MGRISDEDIQRVREAIDLVALVSERVVLKKRGRDFWGCCPFHAEKTPSFKVDPATQLWHCFGCGAGGDVFGFVMRSEDVDFPDAVRMLAERARIEIVEEGGPSAPPGRKERLMAACEAAADFYHRVLLSSRSSDADAARRYLAGRGFSSEVAKRWRLGYAPRTRDTLVRALVRQGFEEGELVDANLAVVRDGMLRDRFFDRIMFPIANLTGRVVAFGGRTVGTPGPRIPKYLNSNETLIFHKSSNLYGIDRARAAMATSGVAVIVEGYTDVIALHEAGLTNVVATLGTALGVRHLKLLGRFAKRIVYLFDGDEAGIRAALRAAEFVDATITPEAGASRTDVAVAVIPEGMDPADYVAAHGADALRALVGGAEPILRFALDQRLGAHDLTTPEGKARALEEAVQVLAPIKTSILAAEYCSYIADRLLTDVGIVRAALERVRPLARASEEEPSMGSVPVGGDRDAAPATPSGMDRQRRLEQQFVGLLAVAPAVRDRARDLLDEEFVLDERLRRLGALIREAGRRTGEALSGFVAARDRDLVEALSGLNVDVLGEEQVEYAFREIEERLKESALERLILRKKVELKALDPIAERERYDALFSEIAGLVRALKTRTFGTATSTDEGGLRE